MNPYMAYQQRQGHGQTRIDSILGLYEQAIQRLETALACLQRKEQVAAQNATAPVHLILTTLASGIDAKAGDMGVSFLKLFEFVAHCLQVIDAANLQAALKVMRTLHEAFVGIRSEAVQMERSGELQPLDQLRAVETRA